MRKQKFQRSRVTGSGSHSWPGAEKRFKFSFALIAKQTLFCSVTLMLTGGFCQPRGLHTDVEVETDRSGSEGY